MREKNIVERGIAAVLTATLVVTSCPVHAAGRPAPAKKTMTLYVNGTSKQKKKTIKMKNAKGYSLSFASSKTKVASVTKKGVVTAKKAGKTTITIRASKGKKTYTSKVTVTVKKKAAADQEQNAAEFQASQTGRKQITVKCGEPMAKEDISLYRNNAEVGLTSVVLSEDGMEAVLETENQLQNLTYKVKVKEMEASVSAEASKVADIELLSDKLALDSADMSKAEWVRVGFRIINQFGEDVTKQECGSISTSAGSDNAVITANSNGIAGMIKIKKSAVSGTAMPGVTYPLTVSYSSLQDQIFLTKTETMTISAKPGVGKITVQDTIYNADDKVFGCDSNPDKEYYYILVSAQDELGNDLNKMEALKENENGDKDYEAIVILNGATTGVTLAEGEPEVLTVDNQNYLGYRLVMNGSYTKPQKGSVEFIIYGATGGASASQTYTMDNGSTVAELSIHIPRVVPAGEDVEFEYEALDSSGNPVTDISSLNDLIPEDQKSTFRFRRNQGNISLYRLGTADSTLGTKSAMFMTKDHKALSFQYSLRSPRRPSVIVGTSGLETGTTQENNIILRASNFVIEDQYGDIISPENYSSYSEDYAISMYEEDTDDKQFSVSKTLMTMSGSTISIKAAADVTGTKKFVFRLTRSGGQDLFDYSDIYGWEKNRTGMSELEVPFTCMQATSFSGYYVEDFPMLHVGSKDNSNYELEVKVYAKKGNKKIRLSTDDYTVNVPHDSDFIDGTDGLGSGLSYSAATNTIKCTFENPVEEMVKSDDHVKELTREVEIVINNDGENPITKEVTISREDYRAVSSYLVWGTLKKKTTSLSIPAAELNTTFLTDLALGLRFTDQYGKSNADNTAATTPGYKFRIQDIDSVNGTLRGNNTVKPQFGNFVSGDSFTIVFDFGRGVELPIDVTVN